MADTKISALTAVASVADANEFAVNEAGTSKKASAAQVKTYIGGPSFTKLTSDIAQINDTTLVNILSFAVTNGVYYHFKFVMVWQSGTVTTGLKSTLTTPTFTIFAANSRHHGHASDGSNTEPWAGNITSSGDVVTCTAAIAINTDYGAIIEGVILPSADGTLQLQAAAEVVAAGGVTIRQGSFGRLQIIP